VCFKHWVKKAYFAILNGVEQSVKKERRRRLMEHTNLMNALLASSPWQLGLWMSACGVGVLSWLLTLKVFVSYGEHNELKAYVAEHYLKRSEIQTHLNDLHQQLQSMQQQLNLMQQALYRALNK
jgi:hypothetical protein